MSRTLAHTATFAFAGATYFATSVSVEAPQPEIVAMTSINDPNNANVMVPTGAYTSPGRIAVECFGSTDPKNLVGVVGQAQFTNKLATITRNVVCDSASTEGQVGSLLRLRFTLMPTDYSPT